jgi:hypothetical protein
LVDRDDCKLASIADLQSLVYPGVTLKPDRYGRLRVTVDCGGKVRDFSLRQLE